MMMKITMNLVGQIQQELLNPQTVSMDTWPVNLAIDSGFRFLLMLVIGATTDYEK